MVVVGRFSPPLWEGGGRVPLTETRVFASEGPVHDSDLHLHALAQIADYCLVG